MNENVENDALQILTTIQEDLASFRREVSNKFDHVEERLNRIEAIQKQERRNTAAMLVMMRGTAGVYEERLTQLEVDRIIKLEDRMTALERRLT